jgi:hypothetical protein
VKEKKKEEINNKNRPVTPLSVPPSPKSPLSDVTSAARDVSPIALDNGEKKGNRTWGDKFGAVNSNNILPSGPPPHPFSSS